MGINLFSYGYNEGRPLVDARGIPVKDGRDFFRALFNRTGGGNGGASVAVSLVAAGTSQATAFGLTADKNYVETVAANSGVILPPMMVGADCMVWNAGANTLRVYPAIVTSAKGGPVQIDALGANNPYQLTSGKMQWFHMIKPALISSMQFG